MLSINVRKLKKDFPQSVLAEGKTLYTEGKVLSVKILSLDADTIRIHGKVLGQYDNSYESEIEIDRNLCEAIDSDCDCPYNFDCQHLAALLFYLEAHLEEIIVEYSKETDIETLIEEKEFSLSESEELLNLVKQAVDKKESNDDEQHQKELLNEYHGAVDQMLYSPFFTPKTECAPDNAQMMVVLQSISKTNNGRDIVELNFYIRVKDRSKPISILNAKDFIEGILFKEPVMLHGKEYNFTVDSFSEHAQQSIMRILEFSRTYDNPQSERGMRNAFIELNILGSVLYEESQKATVKTLIDERGCAAFDFFYMETIEKPMQFQVNPAQLSVGIEYIDIASPKVLLIPKISVSDGFLSVEQQQFVYAQYPGMILDGVYYHFPPSITRRHLEWVTKLQEVTIPEPLIGTFMENAVIELTHHAEIDQKSLPKSIVTYPYVKPCKGYCNLTYLNGELEARLGFYYDDQVIPYRKEELTFEHLKHFVSDKGILSRNLHAEKKIKTALFADFELCNESGAFAARTDKRVIDFMTRIVPQNRDCVEFVYPENLLDRFVYDETHFSISLKHSGDVNSFSLNLDVKGELDGIKTDQLWECIVSKKTYIEKKKTKGSKLSKILVLNLERISPLVQFFDEIGIKCLEKQKITCPLWSLTSMQKSFFDHLPVRFSIDEKLSNIQKQIMGTVSVKPSSIPKEIKYKLRSYQKEGIYWLERIRSMYLGGILADDMGLGKTIQTIAALCQAHGKEKKLSLVVCTASLLYNWKEEFSKAQDMLNVMVVDGTPQRRKKLYGKRDEYDVMITSYSLLQKDVELLKDVSFHYLVLDEAQQIKNRGTRNAKSVKQLKGDHKLVLSGTPIENSLDELWSLFDFLMPGFLGSYERFVEKYLRKKDNSHLSNLDYLKTKSSPFLLRRMKKDVLKDLPPVSHIPYHCQLTSMQKELYDSYVDSARQELERLVDKEGFNKVRIHVLATLTRLKQICCHPGIFSQERIKEGDSAKYEMLKDLLSSLISGDHKTVIFSQYTKMLNIMRKDFKKSGIPFCYLDGTTKNRMDVVHQFNNDPKYPVFLVSLKAGGTGLNLTGADSVIHYDMWWNPAIENQATDRVHRLGQDKAVSVYKLITLNTIEEKIIEMQSKKSGIVKKIISSDDEVLSKLTWDDVLELLKK